MPVDPTLRHPWNVAISEARAIQERLSGAVRDEDDLPPLRRVAGIDVGPAGDGRIRAAVVVLDAETLTPVEHTVAEQAPLMPYVPGYLSFREVPPILDALAKLTTPPDVLLCDGQGRAHPRGFGVACHVGVLADIPAIGVAKKRLVGTHDPVPEAKGAWSPLVLDEAVIGAVLRSRAGVNPIYVSVGHRVSLETAVSIVMRCLTRYRLPETTRLAHGLASLNRAP